MKFAMIAAMLTLAIAAAPVRVDGQTKPAPEGTAAVDRVALPDWMAGEWTSGDGGSWAEEFWTGPRADIVLGVARSGRGDTLTSWESMRIVREGRALVFIAQPQGAPPTRFALRSSGPRDLTFVNAATDYPQKVRYWREGENLLAEISLANGGRAMRWRFRRMSR